MAGLIDIFVYAGSVFGLLLSAILTGLGVAAFPSPLAGVAASLAKVTLFGLFPIGGVFVFRYNNLIQDTTPRDVKRWGYRGCPPWMRVTCYGLMGAGLALFFLPAFLETIGTIPRSDGSAFPATLPGGFGLIAYSSVFAQLYSLKTLANLKLNSL